MERLERDGARGMKTGRTSYTKENPKSSIRRGRSYNSHLPHCPAPHCLAVVVHFSTACCAKVSVAGIATGPGMLARYHTLAGHRRHRHMRPVVDRIPLGHSHSRHSCTDQRHTHYWSATNGLGLIGELAEECAY